MKNERWFRKPIFTKLLLVFGGIIIGLLLVEGGLRIFESITGDIHRDLQGRGQLIADEKLGTRVAANAPGHDANGFRNKEIAESIDIICIGDSQTWSNNAPVNYAWPQTLERLSGYSVYNMGMGGYGPAEYYYLTEEACDVSPEIVIAGLYMGNDIADAYITVYLTDRLPQYRDPEANASLYENVLNDQAEELVENRDSNTSWAQNIFLYDWLMNLRDYSAAVRKLTDGLQSILDTSYNQGKNWAISYPEEGSYYENDGIKTIFTPANRLLVLDTDREDIEEGLKITKNILKAISMQLENEDIKFLVLVIPTKEAVYADAVTETQGSLSDTYTRLIQAEEKVKEDITAFCGENGIEIADALPSLKEGVVQNEELYPESADGHPVALGYYRIAQAARDALVSLGWIQ